jgi:tetratricopeptide (TPR) repeat protein
LVDKFKKINYIVHGRDAMNFLDDRKLLGDILRKRISELGLRQKDLIDENLTSTTISNIITGKKKVGKKTIAYLCKKIGWELEKIPQYIEEIERNNALQLTQLKLNLKSIETNIDGVSAKYAFEQIKKLELPDDPFILSTVEYLKGKCYFKKDNWAKARDHYLQSIRLYDSHPNIHYSNLKSACLYELARVYYRQNEFEYALKTARKGLEAFVPEGERKYYKYHLHISEAIYLDSLGLYVEAMKVVEKMWAYQSEIETETQLNMYGLQAILYNKLKMYDEAIKIIDTAIEIARREKHFDHSFELWTTLGVSYKSLGHLDLAKTCFDTASRLKNKIRKKYLLPAYNYTESGKLFLSEGNIEKAKEVLLEAVKLSKKANDGLRQLDAQVALGECYLQQDKFFDAIQEFEEACEVAKKLSFLDHECSIVLKLAQCYEDRDTIKYNKYYARFYQLSVKLLNGGEKNMWQNSNSFQKPEREFQPDPPDG